MKKKTLLFFPEGLSRKVLPFFRRVPRLISLDFDGTLAPIAPTPAAARMPEDFRQTLVHLSRLRRTRLAILSGRSLKDLKRKVRLPGVIYVGNHGLDFSPSRIGWGKKALAKWSFFARLACGRLRPLVKNWPGALLEAKGPDFSLHYRLSKPALTRRFIPEALRLVRDLPLKVRYGKCVLEFRPKNAPGKGEALEHLRSLFFQNADARCLFIHVGDDKTDEDAFRVLRGMGRQALGLKVGNGPTLAHYRLRGVGEVLRFLNLLLFNGRKQNQGS
jgi:trehalose-phosphatase